MPTKQTLRAMTKPALITFSNTEAINFYFNAKLTDFAMFSYQLNIWLTYCPMYRDYETHRYLFSTFHSFYGNHQCTIKCYSEKGGVAAFKGLFNVLNNNIMFYFFLDILTQNILNEIDRVFNMTSLALIIIFKTSFKLVNYYLTSFSFRGVLTSPSNLTILFLFKCSYIYNYTS